MIWLQNNKNAAFSVRKIQRLRGDTARGRGGNETD
jgi:hypothetical protein